MENISNFLNACKEMGIQSKDLFQTTDLYEGKDMGQVVITILNLARVSGRDSFIRSGPVLSSLYSNSTTGLKDKTKSVDSLSTTGDRKASSTNRSNPSRASFSTEGKSSTLKPGASQISTGERIKEESFGDSPSKPRVSNASQDRDAAKGEKLAMADDGAKEVAQYVNMKFYYHHNCYYLYIFFIFYFLYIFRIRSLINFIFFLLFYFLLFHHCHHHHH